MSTASIRPSPARYSIVVRSAATPCPIAHVSRAEDTSAAQTSAPRSRSTRRCFSPQRPRPMSRTFTAWLLADEIAAQVLGDLVLQRAGLHPAHDEQIRGGDEHAIEHAVLRLPEASRPVTHRDLDDAIATHLEERRHEPMEAAVEHEPAQAFPTERAEGTAAVLDHVVAEPVAHAVRDTGGQPAHHRIAVAA